MKNKMLKAIKNRLYKVYYSTFKFISDRKKTKLEKASFSASSTSLCYENNDVDLQSIKKVAIVACFFSDGLIPDYLIYYIKKLKLVYDAIIVIADSPIIKTELKKIQNYVLYAKFNRHGEYDFGSYKLGYEYLFDKKILNNIESVLLTNDSCYGPVYDLSSIINFMEKKNVDFWGLTQNDEYKTHIQSYFIVFNNKSITSKPFKKFILSIKKQKYYLDIIKKYETKLTSYLAKRNFSYDTYIPSGFNYGNASRHTNKTLFPYELLRYGKIPLVKIKEFTQFYNYCDQREEVLKIIKIENYELYLLIKKHLKLSC